jgi:hypothetical protein
MLAESSRAPRRAIRSVSERLRAALIVLADGQGEILSVSERAWASITFEGARYTVAIAFEGDEAVDAGERFIAALPDHEFAIPGQLVAEASVVEADHRLLPSPRLSMRCELLLLRDA